MTNPNHTDTSRSGDLVEPLFSCSQDGCREESSYPADMLALHNGAPICEDCYHDLPFNSQAPDPDDEQETLIWHDLPRFVPSFARRIEALEAENAQLQLECKAQYDRGYYDGRQYDGAEERAKIVAWLRSDKIVLSMDGSAEDVVASAIEAEDHLK